ncbi:MAG: hypothetical protein BGO98_08100 [Myxococcales bacterium 68-20]|nr:MAG: hypothetical protein BGO98_08100 [Myxococcales bacterium 68-20]
MVALSTSTALASASAGVLADEPERRPMTLDHAIAEGARRGPAVIESNVNREAAVAFAQSPGSSLPSTPQLTVLAGARRPYNLPTGPEVVVTVQQELAFRGLGSARERAASWALHAASSDVDRARIEGAATAALAWIDLLEAQGLVDLRKAAAEDAAKLERIAEVRVTSGAATALERSLARAEVGGARVAVLDGEGRATHARLTLAHAVGTSMDGAIAADGMLERSRDEAVDARSVVDALASHPAVRAAEARAAQASAEASVTRALLGPTMSIGGSAWREGSGDHAAAAIVTLPLPFFDPSRHDVGRQATIAAAATSHAARMRTELEREARLALHEREHTREVRAELRDAVVAPLRSATNTAMTAYSAGTSELGVVLLARRTALAAEERLVTAMADVWRSDIRLSALRGTLVATGGSR